MWALSQFPHQRVFPSPTPYDEHFHGCVLLPWIEFRSREIDDAGWAVPDRLLLPQGYRPETRSSTQARGSHSNDAMKHRVLKTAQQGSRWPPVATNSVIMTVRKPLAALPVRLEVAPAITDEARDRDGCRLRTQNPGTEADWHKSMGAGQFHLRAAPSAFWTNQHDV